MSPTLRVFIRCLIAFAVIFFGLQIYNRSCLLSHNCRPFYFARYIPRTETNRAVNIHFEVTNHRENLEFEVINPDLSTYTNRINSVIFRAKNTSKRKIGFRPVIETIPSTLTKYIERLQCPCSQKYLLNPGEEISLEMEFFLDPAIDKEADFISLRRTESNLMQIIYKIE